MATPMKYVSRANATVVNNHYDKATIDAKLDEINQSLYDNVDELRTQNENLDRKVHEDEKLLEKLNTKVNVCINLIVASLIAYILLGTIEAAAISIYRSEQNKLPDETQTMMAGQQSVSEYESQCPTQD